MKYIPELLSYGNHKNIEKTTEFKRMIEGLLLRARGDNVDSIRIQAEATIREIIVTIEDYLPDLLYKLSSA